MTTLELGKSNLKQLLKYKLKKTKPSKYKTRSLSFNWAFVCNHQFTQGFKIYVKVTKAWKKIMKVVQSPPNHPPRIFFFGD
jgi:hypothetical protein